MSGVVTDHTTASSHKNKKLTHLNTETSQLADGYSIELFNLNGG